MELTKMTTFSGMKFRHETPFITLAVLFAEGLPSRWEENVGRAQTLLIFVWNIASMFIVFFYLCNLRSVIVNLYNRGYCLLGQGYPYLIP